MALQEAEDCSHLKSPRKKIQKGKTKVKTACRTCKIRRVKCDEGRPACNRCVSTGRVCDGYGIWGGGGNSYSDRSISSKDRSTSTPITLRHNIPAPPRKTARITTSEQDCFEWFTCQAVKKFPGLFGSPFWDTLVCQASLSEPAVLHAILAFSSAYKKEGLDSICRGKSQKLPDELEQFTLQQYSHAIGHLQAHFETKSKDSVRVALVTCLIFIYMEFVRGHYKAANVHLHNGLKLIGVLQGGLGSNRNGIVDLKVARSFEDSCIMDTFVRLQTQALLIGKGPGDLYLVSQGLQSLSSDTAFESVTHARRSLDRIQNEIFHLTEQFSREEYPETQPIPTAFLSRQILIQKELTTWYKKYKTTQKTHHLKTPFKEEFCYQVLHFFHTMATILASTSLQSTQTQSIFDAHLPNFISILAQAMAIRKIIMSIPHSCLLPGLSPDLSDAIAEMGWVSPLYYTALKCRHHRVRVQAIRLLRSVPHKEGMWDATIAAAIAEQVMDIEEGDTYRDFQKVNEFPLCEIPEGRDLEIPVLEEGKRVCGVTVVLPDDCTEKILLTCRRKRGGGEWEFIGRGFEVPPVVRAKKEGRGK